MNSDQTLEIEVAIGPSTGRLGRQRRTTAADSPHPVRMPRITGLMALAIKLEGMVDRGEVRDYADLARMGLVTRARMTQIMNLLNLAPDIQEHILLCAGGTALPRETQIRPIVRLAHWDDQRGAYAALK